MNTKQVESFLAQIKNATSIDDLNNLTGKLSRSDMQENEILLNLGHEYKRLNDLSISTEYYSKFIQIGKSVSSGYFFRGMNYLKQKSYEAAVDDFETLEKVDESKTYSVFQNLFLAHCYLNLKKFDLVDYRLNELKTQISADEYDQLLAYCGGEISVKNIREKLAESRA